MVSYTNHALDEFLGGLPSEGIVRVGGRCSDKLKCCSLKVRRDEATANKQNPRRISKALKNVRDDLRDLEKDGSLERCIAVLKFSRRGILSFHILKPFMSECHVRWFEGKQTERLGKLLCHWLGVQIVASRDSKNDRDVNSNEDFQMQVPVRNFSNEEDFQDDDGEKAVKPSEVTICTAEDTKNPARLRRNLQQEFVTSEDGIKRYRDLKQLSVNQRWKLYRFWVQKTENHYLNELQKKQPDYERALARKFELMLQEDFHVLRNARVIGMTTTCAARYRRILQRIRPKIILVEEAAEVLEAHIITSLTKGCQHLILIGDHQQLRPKPAVYELAKKYKLDVSLFERMMKVGIQCERLSVQHRMRPEIAALMKHIYDDLDNHESVEKYEDVKGMKKNMFFIDHCHLEYSSDGTHSHANEHEATFLVALCRYLLQQGYSYNQITLLTTYTGQMFAIRECLQAAKNEELKRVRLTTVDNFQGEESDVILLSLVRSNKDEKVGFISDVNRACVALSRAKKGLYCIGNFALLSKHSEIWGKIVPDLKKGGNIGNALPLVCQIHHDEMMAETAEDFRDKAPDGGCQRPCEVRLECGHGCKRLCHPYDTDHLEYRCGEPCAKKIERCDHDCPKLCYQKCETDCSELVEKTLPFCGHKKTVRCGTDSGRVRCRERCDKILPTCSHRCQSGCGEPCTKQCQELEKRTDWPCGHEVTIACSATQADCPVPCGATLECGHQCSGKCGECRMGRVHKRCRSKCERLLVCSHTCKVPCPMSCPPCSSPCENRCSHAKCEHECGEACVPCSHKCEWKCAHYKCNKQCGELCNRPRCDEPCSKILRCGSRRDPHPCRGLCGEDCICAECEKNGEDAITEIFLGGEDEEDALFIQLPDCKHIFAVSDLDRYMDTTIDDSDDRHEIQLKSCPRCKSVIRRSLRYGNVIKQQLHDIEQVKRKVREESDEVIKTKERLETSLKVLKATFNGEDEMKEWERLERRMSKRSKTSAVVTENQVTLMERFCAMSQKLKDNLFSVPRSQVSTKSRLEGVFLQGEIEYLKKRFMSNEVTQREFRDINLEFTRLNLQLELCLLENDVTSLNLTLDESSRQVMRVVQGELSSAKLLETKKLDELLERLAAIRGSYPCLSPLTSEEKKQIVSAMDLSQGHWFKCPKGHIYAIGGCGGAMQRSKCPECKAVIGGANHRLHEGNELAPEMDGARHAAWSEQANLQNYNIVDEA
ncbi:NFX1-type zinc finger-containing protein 1 [Acropora cervicornis]|uniref:NFX1-type zinc finger-containing protein 1 n=1 Tax=Acropora cervicornis TaxID=6130 RepID=A0AAD9UYL6_ACRCE|nr:NFX1-type zinc finger-containing protein 1 [Acropora cervicornis]